MNELSGKIDEPLTSKQNKQQQTFATRPAPARRSGHAHRRGGARVFTKLSSGVAGCLHHAVHREKPKSHLQPNK